MDNKRGNRVLRKRNEVIIGGVKAPLKYMNMSSENTDLYPARTVNDLARLRFKEQILKEILFDLMVCKLEGWSKKEYINELKSMLNSINID